MTKKEKFEVLKNMVMASDVESVEYGDTSIDKDGLVEFIDHEIEQLNRKSSKTGETKTQKENKLVMADIVDALGACESPVTITELQASDARMAALSNQKISALMRKLVADGQVVKAMDKKVARFALA